MKTHNPENERIKYRYLDYLRAAKGQSEASIDAVANAVDRFEEYTRHRNFKAFHIQQAKAFREHLAKQISQRTGEPLSKATLHSTLSALRAFLKWLADKPGYKSRISYSDADYFSLSEKEIRIATAHRDRPVPTLEQIEHVIRTMAFNSEIERRDRAIVAFTILTGARDGAIPSLKLKHVDATEEVVYQDPREVDTKASKTITSWFFPVPELFRQIVVEWIEYLLKEKLWGLDDPLFPATEVLPDANRHFAVTGISRKHWAGSTPIREIFKTAFTKAGLPYFNPHSFRKTLALLGEKICRTPEDFKVWSQNLGHEQVMTTFTSYGAVPRHRHAEVMRNLATRPNDRSNVMDLAKALARELRTPEPIG